MLCNANCCRFVWSPVVFAIVGGVVAGCAAPHDDPARAPRDPNLSERADSSDAVGGARLPPDTALGSGKLPIRSVAEQERVTLSTGAKKGKELLNGRGCPSCHRINGQGGTIGPDLSNEGSKGRSRDWLATEVLNPGAHNPQTIMPSFDTLSDKQVNSLVDYLLSLSTSED